ncbi:hypothetical protein BG011_009349 [Mortierella polycephala]|uniref:Yeast cell wall synthesis Kre9/Knh1-like N-terminal domain-containing protein n=1 Tax=Mortierella polycephala TaxID=41804 RepID=A0A9P6U7J8_9FUNG|nr:hypothetical protein BG011_009349 [Mortierella polycephala]
MLFSKSVITLGALVTLLTVVQADMLSISNPTKGTTWKVGESVFLQWNGNCASMGSPAAQSVDVNLMSGPSTALRFVAKMASIDCSGSESRKEFTIPSEVVTQPGDYSLQVQTEPQLSYSNIFAIGTAAGGAASAPSTGGADTGNGDGNKGSASVGGDHSSAASSPVMRGGSSVTAAGVALVAVLVAAQLL